MKDINYNIEIKTSMSVSSMWDTIHTIYKNNAYDTIISNIFTPIHASVRESYYSAPYGIRFGSLNERN